MRQATSWHAPSSPDWIRYEEAEPLFYENFNPVVKAAVKQYAYNFGSDVVVMANHITVELEAQAIALLDEAGIIRAFSDMNIHSKIHQWVTHWCEHYGRIEEWGEQRDQAEERNAADRLAYIRTKYSEEDAARGRKAAAAKVSKRTDEQARKAQAWKAAGIAVKEIAERLGCKIRNVYNLLKRKLEEVVQSGKEKLCTSRSSTNKNELLVQTRELRRCTKKEDRMEAHRPGTSHVCPKCSEKTSVRPKRGQRNLITCSHCHHEFPMTAELPLADKWRRRPYRQALKDGAMRLATPKEAQAMRRREVETARRVQAKRSPPKG